MECLAHQLPGLSPDLARTCGLFLHVGLPVMLQSVRGYAGTMVEGLARKDRSFVATENANHRTDHAVVGALVARVWQLEPAVMAAVRLHHDLDCLADDRIEPEVRTLLAAALVADMLMRRHEGLPPDTDWARHAAAALAWLQIGTDDLGNWEDAVTAALDGA
jgi:HD-like signal output (HDOD) protein